MGITTDVVTVLHPAAEDVAEPQCLAPRLASLQGRTVGLIDNHKRNANVYLEALGHLLQDRYGVSHVVTYRKISQSMPTPDEVLDQLASDMRRDHPCGGRLRVLHCVGSPRRNRSRKAGPRRRHHHHRRLHPGGTHPG